MADGREQAGLTVFGRLVVPFRPRRGRQLPVERLAIANAAAQKLRPLGHHRQRIGSLGQERPELRMMPAQLMRRAVAMRANAFAQALDFSDQGAAVQRLEVVVRGQVSIMDGNERTRPAVSLPAVMQNRYAALWF